MEICNLIVNVERSLYGLTLLVFASLESRDLNLFPLAPREGEGLFM